MFLNAIQKRLEILGLRNRKNRYKDLIRVISVAVGIIMFWRGIWGLLDYYLLPDNPPLSFGISLVIGLVILYVDDRSLDSLDGE